MNSVLRFLMLALLVTGCSAEPANPVDGGTRDARADTAPVEAAACPVDQMMCSGVCVNTASSVDNCGRCRNECATGQSCTSGVCVSSTCATGQTRCSDVCVDTSTDSANCGSCGRACGELMACTGGTCGSSCAAPRMTCTMGTSSMCVDVTSDPANCGSCGRACPSGQPCNAGTCGCAAGQMACGTACVDTMTNNENCGACGRACMPGQACSAGSCGCAPPLTACGTTCANLMTDPAHCGSCTAPACNAPNSCNAGMCNGTCGVGTTACGGMCINPQIDNANCGACGNACGASRTCLLGTCRPNNNTRATAATLSLTAAEATVRGNSAGATHDGPTVPCACTSGGDVWYRFTLTAESIVYFDTAGSSFDTSLLITDSGGAAVGAQASNGSAQAGLCNDDALCPMMAGGFTAGVQSRTWGRLGMGSYYVVVGGCGTGGEFTLHAQRIPISAGSEYEGYLGAGLATFNGTLPDFSLTAGSCGGPIGTANGEDWKFFVTCGGARQFFSLCSSDRGTFERHELATDFDPVLYLRSAFTGMEVACNDDGGTMGGTNCAGTGGDTSGFGSRLNDVVTPRGLNAIFVDSRSGGDATFARMNYTVAYFIRNTP